MGPGRRPGPTGRAHTNAAYGADGAFGAAGALGHLPGLQELQAVELYLHRVHRSLPCAFLLYTGLTEEEKSILTDAAKVFVMKGKKVFLVNGETFNIKVTYPYDLQLAETLLGGNSQC